MCVRLFDRGTSVYARSFCSTTSFTCTMRSLRHINAHITCSPANLCAMWTFAIHTRQQRCTQSHTCALLRCYTSIDASLTLSNQDVKHRVSKWHCDKRTRIIRTSAYIWCAHSGTSTRSLRSLWLCARILGHFAPSGYVLCIRILGRFAPSTLRFVLGHGGSFASYRRLALFFLAEYALICAAWDNSQWVNEWKSSFSY